MSRQEQKDVSILPPSRGEHLLLMEGSPPLLASLLLELELTIMRRGTLNNNFPLGIRLS